MTVGIIGAMELEIENLLKHMSGVKTEKISGVNFNAGFIGKIRVVAAVCGIGKVNAAVCAQTLCLKYPLDYIINIGVAGSLSNDITVGDIVAATSVVQHDMDPQLGFPFGYIPSVGKINLDCCEKLVGILSGFGGVKLGIIATGDKFVNKAEDKNFIAENFKAIAVEMEGGSIGHVCCLNDVDFAVIRCISDNADSDSGVDFEKNTEKSARKSIDLVVRLLSEL
jgi:adenosylhomocysteine nucleosidase